LIYGISNDGRLTGVDFSNHAFRIQPDGTFQELTLNFSFGAGINESGDVTGVMWQNSGMAEPHHAYRYSDAEGLVDLGTLDGGSSGGTRDQPVRRDHWLFPPAGRQLHRRIPRHAGILNATP
jgi:probable HAF family extracellular repeat protein